MAKWSTKFMAKWKNTRMYIAQDQVTTNERLMREYVYEGCTFLGEYFQRIYRMRKYIFLRIVKGISTYFVVPFLDHFKYFQTWPDCTGKSSLSSIQNARPSCTLWHMAYFRRFWWILSHRKKIKQIFRLFLLNMFLNYIQMFILRKPHKMIWIVYIKTRTSLRV